MDIHTVYAALSDHEYIICTFALFINVFHLLVLTRRYMRTSSIYILLIGVCLAEIYSMSISVKLKVEQVTKAFQACPLPPSVFHIYLDRMLLSAVENTNRLSIWLIVALSLIRALVLRKLSDNRFQMLSAPGFGWLVTFFSFLVSFLMSLTHYFKDQIVELGMWRPSSKCEPVTVADSLIQYTLTTSDLYTFHSGIFAKLFYFSTGFFTYIVPSFIFPVVILLLAIELFKSQKIRRTEAVNKKDHKNHRYRNEQTTKLVHVLSVLTFLIVLCHSTLFISRGILGTEQELLKFADVIMKWIFAINSASRCFLCALFSCRYRNAVRRMFGFRDQLASHKTSLATVRGNSTPRSVVSIPAPPASPKHESK